MSIPEQVAIVSLEGMIKRQAAEIKRRLANAEAGSEFCFTIVASGRIHDGELKIEYKIADNRYNAEAVVGNRIDAVVEELIRRKGWEKSHTPLQISQSEQDEIPF